MRLPRTAVALGAVSLATTLSAPAFSQPAGHDQHHQNEGPSAMLQTPSSIAAEHRELHETLERAAKEPGALGITAKKLELALAPHFRREEEIATPPLALLPPLASGETKPDMRAVLPMTDALERELPQMLREHEAIRVAVAAFRTAAREADRGEYVRFSDDLAAHARQEEEILYPAAILVGRYVKATTSEK